MRTALWVSLLAVFLAPCAAAGPTRTVDLDRPGALEALAAENPGHHRQVVEFIRVAEKMPCKVVPRVTAIRTDSPEFSCAPTLLMTSYPPKRRVAFTLDETRYRAVVTITDPGARLMPAR